MSQRLLRAAKLFSTLWFSAPMLAQAQSQPQPQSLPLRPGSYDTSAAMTIKGDSSEPSRNSRCLSAEQLADVENVFNMRPMAGVCTVSNLVIRAGKINYSADCPNTLVQVSGIVDSDSYSVVRTQKPKQAGGSDVLTRFEGSFAGPCR